MFLRNVLPHQNMPFENITELEIGDLEGRINHIPNEIFSTFPNLNILSIQSKIDEISANDLSGANNLLHLSLPSNKLRKLLAGTFQESPQLDTIVFTKNQIETIDDFTFKNFSRCLHFLYLDENKLRKIGINMFSGLYNLWYLNLDKNRINTIEDGAFANLFELGTLSLNHNKLKVINDGVFDGPQKLRRLYIGDNQIERIGRYLYTIDTLQGLVLEDNPINNNIDLLKIATMPELTNLNLNKTGLNLEKTFISAKRTSNSNVWNIRLSNNDITDLESLNVLHIFPNLYQIYLDGNEKLGNHSEVSQRLKEVLQKDFELDL